MNRKGQVLVLFVLLLPIIIMVIGMVTDVGMVLIEASKLDNLNQYIASYSSKTSCDDACVQQIINKNDSSVTFSRQQEGNLSKITLEKNIESLFGKILNLKTYSIKSQYVYGIENGKVIVKKISTKEG